MIERLGNLESYKRALKKAFTTTLPLVGSNLGTSQIPKPIYKPGFSPHFGELYCPRCGAVRRMSAQLLVPPEPSNVLSLTTLRCLQCDANFTALTFQGMTGEELAIFANVAGGIATPNTPTSVAYYLDQAARSQAAGGLSAAVAMYRATLEHLLYEQGYRDGMLGNKIRKLKEDIEQDKAPSWAKNLNVAYLTVINKLGNGSIHPNDGDVGVQSELDGKLLEMVAETFAELLQVIYEEPLASATRLKALQETAEKFKQ
jgi:hypothetical protein